MDRKGWDTRKNSSLTEGLGKREGSADSLPGSNLCYKTDSLHLQDGLRTEPENTRKGECLTEGPELSKHLL